MVIACVNEYSTNVCYSDNYDVASSLATAACNSQGLGYDCEHYFSFASMAVGDTCTLCLLVYNTFKYVVQEVIILTSFFFSAYGIDYTYSSGLVIYACPSYVSYIDDCNFTTIESCQTLIAYCRKTCNILKYIVEYLMYILNW